MVRLGLAVLRETNGGQDLGHRRALDAHALDLLVRENVVDAGKVRLLPLNVGLDENGAHFGRVRESLHRAIRDRAHEGGLARVVAAKEAVLLSPLQPHLRVVKKDLGT